MSSDRGLSAGVVARLQASHITWFPMIRMEFDTGIVRVVGLHFPIEWPVGSGDNWVASRGLGSVDNVTESIDSIEGLRFTLAGIPSSVIAEAQQDKYQGRPCGLLIAFLDDAGVYQVDESTWQGRLDVPVIDRQPDKTCTITVTAEHSMADWRRKRELLFNSVSQKRIAPNDTMLDGIENSKRIEKVVFSKAARTLA
jgi:hypothetical protein